MSPIDTSWGLTAVQAAQTISRTRMMSRYCLTTLSARTRYVPDPTLQAYHVRVRLFHTPSWQELICRFGPKQGLFEFVWSHARSFRSSAPGDELVPRRIAARRSFDTRGSSSSSVSEGLMCQYSSSKTSRITSCTGQPITMIPLRTRLTTTDSSRVGWQSCYVVLFLLA